MSKQVVRVASYRKGSLSGIGRETERADIEHRNPDIDTSRRDFNIPFKETQNGFYAEWNDIKASLNATFRDKKNDIAFEGMIITSDRAFFEDMGWEQGKTCPKQIMKYFEDSYEWAKSEIGFKGTDKNIISAIVHMDETTPHLQLYYLPVVDSWREKQYAKGEDGKVLRTEKGSPIYAKDENGKMLYNYVENAENPKVARGDFWQQRGGKSSYRSLQDSYHEKIAVKYGLERGEIGSDREHLTKHQWQAQELKKEIEPLRNLKAKADDVEPTVSKLSRPGYISIKKEDFERLREQARTYSVNRSDLLNNRKHRKSLAERELELNERENQLSMKNNELDKILHDGSRKLLDKEKDLERLKDELNVKIAEQPRLNELYQGNIAKNKELHMQITALTNEKFSLKQQVVNLKKEVDAFPTQLAEISEDAQKRLTIAYNRICISIEALKMLRYDWSDRTPNPYSANLTDSQARLIDGITNQAIAWATKEGFSELADRMKNTMGLHSAIEQAVKELEPKSRNRGYER